MLYLDNLGADCGVNVMVPARASSESLPEIAQNLCTVRLVMLLVSRDHGGEH